MANLDCQGENKASLIIKNSNVTDLMTSAVQGVFDIYDGY